MTHPDLWEANASWWQVGFTNGADAEYEEQILPLLAEHLAGRRRILDIGTGEGQVARLARGLPASDPRVGPESVGPESVGPESVGPESVGPESVGPESVGRASPPTVVGIDPTRGQIVEAHRRGGGPHYARAQANALPLASSSFDAAVACLVFEHILDVEAAIAEVARVLTPGGCFLFLLNHPLLQTPGSGWIDDHILGEQYWRIGPYLVEDSTVEEVEKDVFIPFLHRPLGRYVNLMAEAGLFITRMIEPAPPPGFLIRAAEYEDAATIPRLLFLRAEKPHCDPRPRLVEPDLPPNLVEQALPPKPVWLDRS
ncbi:MAG: class I SAM-dependent methyltransferase [Acidimicrobiales bacterium]